MSGPTRAEVRAAIEREIHQRQAERDRLTSLVASGAVLSEDFARVMIAKLDQDLAAWKVEHCRHGGRKYRDLKVH
jgi:hypothetical protein